VRALLLDAGNSSVKVAIWEGKELEVFLRLPTREVLKEPERLVEELRGVRASKIVVASVVKEVSKVVKENFHGALFVSADLNLPINIDYKRPDLLGADRIAIACGGLEFAESFIAVSCGTATVVDIVEERTFKGGIIFPGLGTMAESLNSKTSQLPKVQPESEINVPGKSTKECIKAGILLSTVGGIKEVIRRFPNCKVLITGGWGRIINEYLQGSYIPDLSLIGLKKIAELVKGGEPPALLKFT